MLNDAIRDYVDEYVHALVALDWCAKIEVFGTGGEKFGVLGGEDIIDE